MFILYDSATNPTLLLKNEELPWRGKRACSASDFLAGDPRLRPVILQHLMFGF